MASWPVRASRVQPSIVRLCRNLSSGAPKAAKPTATVVGSGCFGVGAAYFLARKGFDVTVLDKRNGAAMGTSWGNASSLRESSFGAGAGPGAMPALLKSLYNHDGTYGCGSPRSWPTRGSGDGACGF